MKTITLVLLVLLVWLQYKIWLQEGGVPEILQLEKEVAALEEQVSVLRERNASLDAEVRDLKKGLDAIEERARNEMGMIGQDEVYYQVVERPGPDREGPESAEPQTGQQQTDSEVGAKLEPAVKQVSP